jgi:hypothetical protein
MTGHIPSGEEEQAKGAQDESGEHGSESQGEGEDQHKWPYLEPYVEEQLLKKLRGTVLRYLRPLTSGMQAHMDLYTHALMPQKGCTAPAVRLKSRMQLYCFATIPWGSMRLCAFVSTASPS